MKWWVVYCNRLRGRVKRPCRFLPAGTGVFFALSATHIFRLHFTRFHGIWLTARVPRSRGAIVGEDVRPVWSKPVMKKKTAAAAAGDARHLAPVESEVLRNHVALIEHLAVRKYDDGDPREPGWITIKTQGAAWIVQVKDPDSACSFSAVGDTLDKALDTAALLLSCDEAPWEPDAFLAAAAARKKKK